MGALENKIDRLARNIDDLEEFLEEYDLTVSDVLGILFSGGHIDLEEKLKEYEDD